MEDRLYVTLGKGGFTLKVPTGTVIIHCANEGNVYTLAEKALQECARHTAGRVYVFCDDREFVDRMNAVTRIRHGKVLRTTSNIRALERVFESVRFFYVQIEERGRPPD